MAFQGSLRELPLPDIIQLVSVSGKTGMFILENGSSSGEIYLRDGQIVHAKTGDLEAEEAVYELAIWKDGNFVFTPGTETDLTTVQKSNTNLLMEAARRIDEWQVLSKKIPSTRLVPVFTDEAATTSVSLTPQEWALVSKIDERRSIEEIAIALGSSAFEVCKVLYGLIASGLVALKEDLGRLRTPRLQKMTLHELGEVIDTVHKVAHDLLDGHDRQKDLAGIHRLGRVELDEGRGTDALLDLVRAEEKIVSGALGPHQSRTFLQRIEQLVVGD